MSCPQVLEKAIDNLYETFSGYPLPEDTQPCSCCHTPIANELLHAAPLRKLAWKHLSDYASDAILTWGDVDCFRHFLPRIIELAVTDVERPIGAPDAVQVFRLFYHAEWRTWPQDEQASIERLLAAVWETVRSNPPIESGWIDVEEWICAISHCESDIGGHLNVWRQDDRLSAAWALSCLVLGSEIPYVSMNIDAPVWREGQDQQEFIHDFMKTPTASPYWDECKRQLSQLLNFVRSPEALEKLRNAELTCNNELLEREFATAQLCIREAPNMKFVRVYRERLYQSVFWEGRTHRLY
jgi:hypothetical protein